MKREHVYYAIIGAGLLTILGIALWQLQPPQADPLDPPDVLVERLNSDASVDEKVEAARGFVRHGEAARREVRAALQQHEVYEPPVVAPLLDATMKNRDYRSMPVVLELLEHPDPQVRGRAGAAARRIMGADFGYRANAPVQEREEIIAVMREDYKNGLNGLYEFYRDQPE